MKEVRIETPESVEAGENGGMYFDAVFIPELSTILEVVACGKSDFEKAVHKFKSENI